MEISSGFVVELLLTLAQLPPVTKDLGFICPLWELTIFKIT